MLAEFNLAAVDPGALLEHHFGPSNNNSLFLLL